MQCSILFVQIERNRLVSYPFCPCLLLNLSPISGRLVWRSRILIKKAWKIEAGKIRIECKLEVSITENKLKSNVTLDYKNVYLFCIGSNQNFLSVTFYRTFIAIKTHGIMKGIRILFQMSLWVCRCVVGV